MMKVSCLVFLTFTLVLCHQVVNKRGNLAFKGKLQVTPESTNQALANLMTAGKPISDTDGSGIVSMACDMEDMTPHCTPKYGGFFCNFGQTTCYATGTVDTGEVKVYSKTHEPIDSVPTGSDQCANRPEFQAIFLRYAEYGDSYTFLNPNVAPWFFTSPLKGCDVFVATEKNHGASPLVIHSNRNQFKKDPVKNLSDKEKFVKDLLKNEQRSYKVIARIYMSKVPSNEEELIAIVDYIKKYYESNPGVKLISYNDGNQGHQFIGHYNNDFNTWRFINKGENDGNIAEFSVNGEGNLV
ncbi:unnamed protein product [Porites lobata]|uniref:Uncharacterized protein n=1 Tax=Porites lobata TaxID=104759 RepID=A0ABN8RC57_9CNID|nr:unnamed protein product [Porites lobata]